MPNNPRYTTRHTQQNFSPTPCSHNQLLWTYVISRDVIQSQWQPCASLPVLLWSGTDATFLTGRSGGYVAPARVRVWRYQCTSYLKRFCGKAYSPARYDIFTSWFVVLTQDRTVWCDNQYILITSISWSATDHKLSCNQSWLPILLLSSCFECKFAGSRKVQTC